MFNFNFFLSAKLKKNYICYLRKKNLYKISFLFFIVSCDETQLTTQKKPTVGEAIFHYISIHPFLSLACGMGMSYLLYKYFSKSAEPMLLVKPVIVEPVSNLSPVAYNKSDDAQGI